MTTLRAVIVDDEPLSRRALRQLLSARADVAVIAECGTAAQALVAAPECDVLFLDIEMPGDSGLTVAHALRGAASPIVVFVTAYAEHAAPAFDLDVADYLTKPVEEDRLARALDRVHARHRAARTSPAPLEARLPHLVVRVGPRELLIPTRDVVAVEADGVYVAVHAGRRYLLRQSMHRIAALLGDDFVRVHRSWLVRRSAITALRHPRGGRAPQVELAGGLVVPIGRRRAAQVRQWIGVVREV
ncbi:MAG: LytTR family DNA-binding domain-containing protein [Gemmatimonadaceae bacterium]|nr:LytTR family DNA-binding domain-containing protein [Gemmatimonadaceae bacterium]